MTGGVVNLRLVRKAKARAEQAEQAARNRAFHGQTKAERQERTAAEAKAARELDGHRLAGAAVGDET